MKHPFNCPCCKHLAFNIERRRLNTRYVVDERNFVTSCLECYIDSVEYYRGLWEDYYRDCF